METRDSEKMKKLLPKGAKALIAKLKEIQALPEKQFIEERAYKVFYLHAKNIFDNTDFDLKYESVGKGVSRIYSAEAQDKLVRHFKKMKAFLSSKKFSDDILLAFNAAQNVFFEKYNITASHKKEEAKEAPMEKLVWIKKGDFNKELNFRDPGIILKRSVLYSNSSKAPLLNALEILGDKDGSIRINIKFDKKNKEILKAHLGKNKYQFDDFYAHMGYNYFTIPNKASLENLLRDLATLEPSILEVTEEILESVTPFFVEKNLINNWQKLGNFADAQHNGESFLRLVTYKNIHSCDQNPIQEISIRELRGEITISIKVDEKQYPKLIQHLQKAQYSDPDFINSVLHSYRITISNNDFLIEFLRHLKVINPSISSIENEIIQNYDPTYVSRLKTAFLAGLHPRLGEKSDLKTVKMDPIFDPKSLKYVFDFLGNGNDFQMKSKFFPPAKKKASDLMDYDKKQNNNFQVK